LVFERSLAELWHIYALQQSGQSAAAEQLAQGLLDQQSGQPDVRTLRLLLALCGVHYDEANLPMIIAAGTTFREVARRMRRGLSLAWANFVLGYAHYQRNELDSAAEYFGQVMESPYEAHGKAAIDSFVGLALTRCAQGRGDAADDAVRSLREFLLDRGTANLMLFADSLAMRLDYKVESLPAPGGFAGDLEGQMAADLWETPGLTAARVALRSGAPDRLAAAAEILRSCDALAESRHRRRRRIEIAVLAARVRAAQRDHAAALEAVHRAVLLGETGGALRYFLDDGDGLEPYLRQLLDQGVAPDYIRSILAAYPAERATAQPVVGLLPPARQMLPHGTDPALVFTHREMDVLLLLEQRLTNKEIAARLTISPRTVQKHTINIYQKLHASNRREAIARARALGLLPRTS
jgi:LuxR family maltose regulon positive regulatory protein